MTRGHDDAWPLLSIMYGRPLCDIRTMACGHQHHSTWLSPQVVKLEPVACLTKLHERAIPLCGSCLYDWM